MDGEARRQIIGEEEPITCRPADLIPPGLEEARALAAPYMQKEEDVLSVAIFPQVAPGLLQERLVKKLQVDLNLAKESRVFYPACPTESLGPIMAGDVARRGDRGG